MPDPWDQYSVQADALAERYESVPFDDVHAGWMHLIPHAPVAVLDVGAGSGRDAAWLAERGHEVVAVDPARGMRERAQRLHPSSRIRWVDDSLPELAGTRALGERFDLVLLSGSWMHVPPAQRERAFARLAGLLKPGGLVVFTLKHGDIDRGRQQHPADGAELERLAQRYTLESPALACSETPDKLGRPDVSWTTHVFRR